ncbi:MAG TPA: malto-oligosyltrehalose trehalohydrolase [Burkholderiaceae bacterium]|nr:malto-oligosyltrehalose trehalohydrolase [Burkholderiaceae bacterium]
MTFRHEMPFGAAVQADGGVRFRLWAPDCAQVEVELEPDRPQARRLSLKQVDGGWHELRVPDASAGTRYRYHLPQGIVAPDPASRWNPEGVHGPSVVTDPASHVWLHSGWAGRPWHEAVVYELHVGTFTEQGTYRAAVGRLPELAALGITAIELMPLASFPGQRGWGYDGVLPYAPQPAYGTPDELKGFVDEAHGLGLMVLVDVVYNHFGPEGNYLHGWCPHFFNPAHHTPWGAAINFDGPMNRPVRDFFLHNALYWIDEFRFDGLRMDAVHAIRDDSATSIVQEIGEALRAYAGPDRHVHLVLENDANSARLLAREPDGRPVAADAQWNDDFHHAAHVLACGEVDGYYATYADRPLARLGRTLAEGFDFQGEPSAAHDGAARGEPSAHLPSVAFVTFLQNHDQIGNRAFGERLVALVEAQRTGRERLEALQAVFLLAPNIPMLFMGEEWGASSPFQYFCDFGPRLAQAVAQGRREEFRRFERFSDETMRARIPDPNEPATFERCRLDWDERAKTPHAGWLGHVRELLALRQRHLVPRLAHRTLGGRAEVEGERLQVEWVLGDGAVWRMALNIGERYAEMNLPGELVYSLRADAFRLEPDGVRVTVESAGSGGAAAIETAVEAAAQAAAMASAEEDGPGTATIAIAPAAEDGQVPAPTAVGDAFAAGKAAASTAALQAPAPPDAGER